MTEAFTSANAFKLKGVQVGTAQISPFDGLEVVAATFDGLEIGGVAG
jgi:hypothetical protein